MVLNQTTFAIKGISCTTLKRFEHRTVKHISVDFLILNTVLRLYWRMSLFVEIHNIKYLEMLRHHVKQIFSNDLGTLNMAS